MKLLQTLLLLVTVDIALSGYRFKRQACSKQYDVAFAVDSSGSVGDVNFRQVISAIQETVNTLDISSDQTRVAALTFSGSARVEFNLNQYSSRSDIIDALGRIEYYPGSTNTADAFRQAEGIVFQTGNGDRVDRKNVLVIFTDGDSDNMEQTIQEATQAKLTGITIIMVAIGDWVNMFEITSSASYPQSETVLQVANLGNTQPTRDFLGRILCNGFSGCSTSPCQNGGTCIDDVTGYLCQCPSNRGGSRCELSISDYTIMTDLAIAIDSSLDEENFGKVLDFVRNFINLLNIGSSNTRVAILTFSEQSQTRLYLDTYQSKRSILDAVGFLGMQTGTRYASALDAMTDQIFQPSQGDRTNAPNIGVVISDGYASSRESTLSSVTRYREAGNSLVVVGVNPDNVYDSQELQIMASDPDNSNLLTVNSYDQLTSFAGQLFSTVFQGGNSCANNPCQGGGVCVRTLNGFSCECPAGRTGSSCERVCDGKLDVAFLIDSSGSIRHEKFPEILQFVADISNMFEVRSGRTSVGVIVYSDQAYLRIKLSEYTTKEDLVWAIKLLQYTPGRTNTAGAISMLRTELFQLNNGDRYDAPNIAIVISDGHDTVNPLDTLPQAIAARENGIHFMVVTLESDAVSLEVKGIASDPDEYNVFTARKFDDLPGLVNSIVQATCVDHRVCDVSPCRNGGTCLPQLGTFYCLCQDRYTARDCSRQCTSQKDIVFILDASGSVTTRFELEQALTKKIVYGLNFAGSRVRVGVLTYQNTAQIQFQLNRYTLKDSVLNAVAFTNQATIAGTNTADALSRMRQDMFRSSNGDRNGVDNVAIVMTDGKSNINAINTIPEADSARRSGIRIMAVGIGESVDNSEIDNIANQPSTDNAFYLRDATGIDNTADAILNQLCV